MSVQQKLDPSTILNPPLKSQVTPFNFVPYIGNCIPEDSKITYINTQINQQVSYQKTKRKIIMSQSNVITINTIMCNLMCSP